KVSETVFAVPEYVHPFGGATRFGLQPNTVPLNRLGRDEMEVFPLFHRPAAQGCAPIELVWFYGYYDKNATFFGPRRCRRRRSTGSGYSRARRFVRALV